VKISILKSLEITEQFTVNIMMVIVFLDDVARPKGIDN